MCIIVITGTPGTGKSTVAKILARENKWVHVDLTKYVIKKRLFTHFDEERESYVVDMGKLKRELESFLSKLRGNVVIIEGHYAEESIPDRFTGLVKAVFVFRTHPLTLWERLAKRGYKTGKIRENVEAELVGVCLHNALSIFKPELIYEVDTTALTPLETARVVKGVVTGSFSLPSGPRIDWLSKPDVFKVLSRLSTL